MSEAGELAKPETQTDEVPKYLRLIKEVYIDPVRSVVVVDDEFPSLDALVEKELSPDKGWKGEKQNAEAVRDILKFCRERRQPWLVDVHDGREITVDGELCIASHLHHSDLMILDYHLLGDSGTGEKSIQIMKNLAANPHFNLVVVYTKGQAGDITGVVLEVALALTNANFSFMSAIAFDALKEAIDELDIEHDGIVNRFDELIGSEDYLKERASPGVFLRSVNGQKIIEELKKLEVKSLTPKNLVTWLLEKKHRSYIAQMSDTDYGDLDCHCDGSLNWIKTDSLFVTVVSKDHKPVELESRLIDALAAFDPGPHQLLMTKMRAQIDKKGVLAEAAVLNDKYIQAGWLSDLLSAEPYRKPTAIRGTVDRHWEALGDKMRADVDEFAGRLVMSLQDSESDTLIKRYCGHALSDKTKVLSHVNAYNSTKPVDLSHLRTGHIFRLWPNEPVTEPQYWICLSPACDLVPGQKTSGWRGKLGDRIPFMAVLLSPLEVATAIKRVQDNIQIFMRTGEEVNTFSFCPDANPQAAPHWEQMLVLNQGKFGPHSELLKVCRIRDSEGDVTPEVLEVEVIAQLRYEYALNLLQRLAGNFSRVGLDFRSRD